MKLAMVMGAMLASQLSYVRYYVVSKSSFNVITLYVRNSANGCACFVCCVSDNVCE